MRGSLSVNDIINGLQTDYPTPDIYQGDEVVSWKPFRSAISLSIYEYFYLCHELPTYSPSVCEEPYQTPFENLDTQYSLDPLHLIFW